MNVLEGTVRRAANRVRVSVELVEARNDSTTWADSYDRDLTDIFRDPERDRPNDCWKTNRHAFAQRAEVNRAKANRESSGLRPLSERKSADQQN
jgi:hypothetical protein